MAAPQQNERPIIIKRFKRAEAAHHGGAWKVAYADFVTAMMAFFLVMWLVTSVSKEQRAAIFDYFKNPSMEPGKSAKPAPGQMGPGGASTSPINLGGGLDAPRVLQSAVPGIGLPVKQPTTAPDAKKAAAEERAEIERKQLAALLRDLREAIGKTEALSRFKEQLLLDITPDGLRIQIVDAQNRPMFDLGSSRLKDYTGAILRELTPYLNSVPNRIALTGHTDTAAYAGLTGYTNWELSSERANAARRALEAAGLTSGKVARVVGLASSALFDKENPRGAVNRRISIVVMTRRAEEAALRIDVPAAANATDPVVTDAAAAVTPRPSAAAPDPAIAELAASPTAAGHAVAAPPAAKPSAPSP